MNHPSPTSADLLLAHHVLQEAYARRNFEIHRATGFRLNDPGYGDALAKWEKGLETYIAAITDELKITSRIVNGESIQVR